MKKRWFLKAVISGLIGVTCVMLSAQTGRTALRYRELHRRQVSIDGRAVAEIRRLFSTGDQPGSFGLRTARLKSCFHRAFFSVQGNNSDSHDLGRTGGSTAGGSDRGEALVKRIGCRRMLRSMFSNMAPGRRSARRVYTGSTAMVPASRCSTGNWSHRERPDEGVWEGQGSCAHSGEFEAGEFRHNAKNDCIAGRERPRQLSGGSQYVDCAECVFGIQPMLGTG